MSYAKTYLKLADFGRELLTKNSYEEGMPLISKYAKDVIGAQRCSVFIYNEEKENLWTTIADGIERIEIEKDKGIVGLTIEQKQILIVNEPYNHPHFLADIDKISGFETINLITAPIFGAQGEILGILELLNKENGFDETDRKFMKFFAHYISGFLELINMIQQIKEKH